LICKVAVEFVGSWDVAELPVTFLEDDESAAEVEKEVYTLYGMRYGSDRKSGGRESTFLTRI
jgi:hypothetical protein